MTIEALCARCMWCPFDERDLPALPKVGASPAAQVSIAKFDCEPTQRRQRVDGGMRCRHFRARPE